MYSYYVLTSNQQELIKKYLSKRKNLIENRNENSNILWRTKNVNVSKLKNLRLFNHFENSEEITNKINLLVNLNYYYMNKNLNIFDYVPITYISSPKNGIYLNLEDEKENSWILKPEFEFGGSNIKIFGSNKNVMEFLKNENNTWVVQKYISNPLLYQERKIDFRVNVLVTDEIKIYMNKNLIFRTTSVKYESPSVNTDITLHITNGQIQKKHPDFGKYEEGNKIKNEEFINYYNIFRFEELINQIKPVILDVINLLKIKKKKYKCFEIFGFDFCIDENFKCWLLECNVNPGFSWSNKRINEFMEESVDEFLNLTVDKIFKTGYKFKGERNWELIN